MRILLAIDRSEPAARARDLLSTLTIPGDSAISVLMVLPQMAIAYGGDVEVTLERFLRDAATPLRAPDRTIEPMIRIGRPASVISDLSSQYELVVIGSHARGALGEIVVGSTSAEVVDHASCPVLVARRPAVTRLLYAEDGSATSAAAAAFANGCGLFRGLPAHVVAVVPTPDPATGFLFRDALGEVRAEHAAAAMARVRGLEAAGVPSVECHVVDGDPAHGILDVARDVGADAIVMGTHGRTGMRRLLLGSVARSVLHRSAASVLLVRGPEVAP